MTDFAEHIKLDVYAAYEELGDPDAACEKVRRTIERFSSVVSPEQEAALENARKALNAVRDSEVENLRNNATLVGSGQEAWYTGAHSETAESHWQKLKQYLIEEKGWDEGNVNSIHLSSDQVVSTLGNPNFQNHKSKGLVVGYVQSGKTANMTAVIAKAVDSGYRMIVILAGLTNALRSQTQERMEKDLVARNRQRWDLLTTVDDDFEIPSNEAFSNLAIDVCRLAVIKKNKSPLTKFIETLRGTTENQLRNTPVLIIDDECDQASVNASNDEQNFTTINQLVRDLVEVLPSVTYTGYTATPFANVLINPAALPDNIPNDLYPTDFIKALPKPDGYFGTEDLFGRPALDESEVEVLGYDMIRDVELDEIPFLRPAKQSERESFQPEMTQGLRKAVLYYIMAVAARFHRGQSDKHSSMLLHTSVNVDVHQKQAALINQFLDEVAALCELEDREFVSELEGLWAGEQRRVDPAAFDLVPVSFVEIWSQISDVLQVIKVIVENGESDDRIDYDDDDPKRYIVIGGSVLARGLTIEGLIVSLFLRTSSQYDTLLQMGRWFGFRPGFGDLPRIWMTPDMQTSFSELAGVEAEIREDIERYAVEGMTPTTFAVRIRQVPGMMITAKNKMRASRRCDISFSNTHIQTFQFRHRGEHSYLRNNWDAGAGFLDEVAKIAEVKDGRNGRFFSGVPADLVTDFLEHYVIDEHHKSFQAEYIRSFIDTKIAEHPMLSKWNVGIVEPTNGSPSIAELGALGLVNRVSRAKLRIRKEDDRANIKALMSLSDILIDIDRDQGAPATGSWSAYREFRERVTHSTPLLLLYVIRADSPNKTGSEARLPLDADMDVLGLGMVFPDTGSQNDYVQVILPELEEDEREQEEEPEEVVVEEVSS